MEDVSSIMGNHGQSRAAIEELSTLILGRSDYRCMFGEWRNATIFGRLRRICSGRRIGDCKSIYYLVRHLIRAETYVTVGEISHRLRRVWGEYLEAVTV
jgi:CRISPR/Cas system-associated protein Cas5 (RAMP superfamily)